MKSAILETKDQTMFTPEELYRLELAMEAKIADDFAYIKIVKDEIKANNNLHDHRFLVEGREILQKDMELKEKIIEMRYRSR